MSKHRNYGEESIKDRYWSASRARLAPKPDPVSNAIVLSTEQKKLLYLESVILPSLWSQNKAAFVKEAFVLHPTEFDVDLQIISQKLYKNKYTTTENVIKDFEKVFAEISAEY